MQTITEQFPVFVTFSKFLESVVIQRSQKQSNMRDTKYLERKTTCCGNPCGNE